MRARRLSLTSLIDVIFLLLLFFMLSSTFSRFAEVELAAAGAGQGASEAVQTKFLQLGGETLSLNGTDMALEDVRTALMNEAQSDVPLPVIVSLRDEVTAQRLTDVLVVLRAIDGLRLRVLGS